MEFTIQTHTGFIKEKNRRPKTREGEERKDWQLRQREITEKAQRRRGKKREKNQSRARTHR
jgi:hypothetical protein